MWLLSKQEMGDGMSGDGGGRRRLEGVDDVVSLYRCGQREESIKPEECGGAGETFLDPPDSLAPEP